MSKLDPEEYAFTRVHADLILARMTVPGTPARRAARANSTSPALGTVGRPAGTRLLGVIQRDRVRVPG